MRRWQLKEEWDPENLEANIIGLWGTLGFFPVLFRSMFTTQLYHDHRNNS